jgi:signal transduction histidine kinase
MRFSARGARLSAVLCAGVVATAILVPAVPAPAASTLDRTGRFAIQWWTIDDGLPEAPVNGVAFAPDGSLYCTTPTRIARFDGVSFEPLPAALTNPVREAIGGFSNIGFDREGRLWVQGGRAAAMLHDDNRRSNRRRWTVHVHPQGRFNSLAFTAAGRPVLVGPNEVLAFDGKRFREVATVVRKDRRVLWRYGDIDPTSGELWLWGDTLRPGDIRRASIPRGGVVPLEVVADIATGGDVISLSFCPEGPLALLPECGALRSADDWQRLPPILPDADYRRSGKISWTADGTVWISSHNGIIACRDGIAEQVTSGLPGFSLRTGAIVSDRQGGIWAACFGGLLAVRRTVIHVEPVADCRAAFERADGSLLVGSPGIVEALPPVTSGAVRPIGSLAGASVPTAILEDGAGRVWVGTQDNFILRIEDGQVTQVTKPAEPFRELRNINALACDATGRVWAATANGLAVHDEATDSFRTITPADRTAQPVVIGLAAEGDGSMLAAIQSRGVERIAADGGTSQILAAADMPGRRTIVFRRDSRGDLWIGGERGLVRHRPAAPTLRLSTATGLVDDTIRQIEEDRLGRLWIATRSGHVQGLRLDDLEQLARGELSIVRGVILGPLDGVGDTECIGRMGRHFRTGDQRLERITVPVSNGMMRFDPATIASATSAIIGPRVARDTDVPYGFRFETPGIHWATPPLHQTRLSGVDDAWAPPSRADRRDYASPPPGEHVFEVRSITGETDRDFPIASLPVVVAAPWWRRPTTLAAFGIALAATAAASAREVTRRRSRRVIEALEWQRAMDRERARIARDIHDSLGAGLTRMAMMSDLARKGATPQANLPDRLDAIYRNARSLARSVDEIVWAVNPRNDTVAQFISYVVQDVEEFVHAGDLSLRLDVPDGPPDERPLPTHVRHHVCLAIREALQNVLRHADARHVDFSIRVDDASINATVRDDGIGFATDRPPAAEQDGLANMRHRIGEVGGSVVIASAPGSGTTVTFRVPVDFRRHGTGTTTLEAIHDD